MKDLTKNKPSLGSPNTEPLSTESQLIKKVNSGIEQLSTLDANPIFVSQVMARIQSKEEHGEEEDSKEQSLFKIISSWMPQVASIAVCSFLLFSNTTNIGINTEENTIQTNNSTQSTTFEPFELEDEQAHLFNSSSPNYSALLDITFEQEVTS